VTAATALCRSPCKTIPGHQKFEDFLGKSFVDSFPGSHPLLVIISICQRHLFHPISTVSTVSLIYKHTHTLTPSLGVHGHRVANGPPNTLTLRNNPFLRRLVLVVPQRETVVGETKCCQTSCPTSSNPVVGCVWTWMCMEGTGMYGGNRPKSGHFCVSICALYCYCIASKLSTSL
jgi:hypothetical protein